MSPMLTTIVPSIGGAGTNFPSTLRIWSKLRSNGLVSGRECFFLGFVGPSRNKDECFSSGFLEKRKQAGVCFCYFRTFLFKVFKWMLARGLVGVLRSNINIETSDNDLTQIWFDTCFNNVMHRTVYLNRQGAWKTSVGFFLWKETPVTQDCRKTGVESKSCWFLFIPTFLITNDKWKIDDPKKWSGRGGETFLCLLLLFLFAWPY